MEPCNSLLITVISGYARRSPRGRQGPFAAMDRRGHSLSSNRRIGPVTMPAAGSRPLWSGSRPPGWSRICPFRSALLLVLERELQLRAVGDRPVLQVDVLLDDLSHPQIADRPSGDPDRLRRRILP